MSQEFGDIDSRSEVFQVFANPLEFKVFECEENDAGWWRKAYSVGARLRGSECNEKVSEIGQRGQASGHRLG